MKTCITKFSKPAAAHVHDYYSIIFWTSTLNHAVSNDKKKPRQSVQALKHHHHQHPYLEWLKISSCRSSSHNTAQEKTLSEQQPVVYKILYMYFYVYKLSSNMWAITKLLVCLENIFFWEHITSWWYSTSSKISVGINVMLVDAGFHFKDLLRMIYLALNVQSCT